MKKVFKLLYYAKPYWGSAALNVLFNLLSVIFSLFSLTMAIPFMGILFDTQKLVLTAPILEFSAKSIQENFYYLLSQMIIENGKASALLIVCIVVVCMTLFKTGFKYAADFFMTNVRVNIVRDIRNDVYKKLLSLPLSYYSESKKGDIMSRMSSDVNEVEISIMSSIEIIFREPITIVIYLVSLLIISPGLTVFALVLLPVSAIIIGRIGKTLKKTSLKGMRRMGVLSSIVEETLSGLKIIKAFNAENKLFSRFNNTNLSFSNLLIKMNRRRYLASPVSEMLGTIVMVIIMYYGGSLVLNNDSALTSQSFIGYLIIFSQIISPAKAFSMASYNIQKGVASVERIEEIINAPDKIDEIENPVIIDEFKDKIEFKNVYFKYNEEYVLKNINFTIEKGKSVALVGQSGSGKSTIVDLLPRFHDVNEGDILIDGISIKNYQIKSLRKLMGNVSQEAILFNDTIFNNIAFGMDDAQLEDVQNAAKVANAFDFINEKENDFYSTIGDRGGKLSGGERQRISIARAVMKNPPILIMDEATSALDSESERLVQDALTKLLENRTSVIIAHRLSTVQHADLILVINEGEIVERGTHQQLLELNGTYKRLHDYQLIKE
ncbi:MAG: antibiotic ABC transporter ATP-binding protein [Bacteroidetes bacterium GWA2_31_9]|nr:MAG: antibiotic ABC transporter ATP-binding protein [Bacteroidetes bacterium GWA2_31_9]